MNMWVSESGSLAGGAFNNIFDQLSKAATKIALDNFEWRYVTLVFFNSTLWYGVEVFLRSYKKSVIVGNGKFYPSFVARTRQYVLFGPNIPNIVQILDWMQDHQFDNTGKYIVICQSQQLEECDEAEAMNAFWNHKIINVVFLKFEDEAIGYTYFPLEDNCNRTVPVKIKLKSCIDGVSTQTCSEIFIQKLKNLHACPIIASTFMQLPYMKIRNGKPTGADGDLLRLIAEGLNASLKVMTPHVGDGWGALESNGSWSGSLADVYYDLANFSITSAALTLARFSYFQMSVDYNTVSVVWVTHPAKPQPSSLKLFRPFQPMAQVALAISFIFVILFELITKSNLWATTRRKIQINRPRSSVVFYSWMICMGLPTTKLPRKPVFLYIVLIWMWYCVLIRTFYQAYLVSSLKGKFYFGEFQTIKEAIDSHYAVGGGAALKDYFIDYPLVYDNWQDVGSLDIIPTLMNVSKGEKFVLAMNMETTSQVIRKRNIKVHILPEKVVNSPTVIFFKKFSPLAESVNCILVRLIESGFADKSYKNYSSKIVVNKPENDLEPINTGHYTGCYGLLILGWVISSIFFIIELLCKKLVY